ncbi:hypothetical protein [Streptomyces rimosus]
MAKAELHPDSHPPPAKSYEIIAAGAKVGEHFLSATAEGARRPGIRRTSNTCRLPAVREDLAVDELPVIS